MSLELEDRLNYCSCCKNRSFDKNKGLVCNITNDIPTFELKCPNYNPEEEYSNTIIEKKFINTEQKFSLISHLNFLFFFKTSSVFYFIFTIINLVLLYNKNFDRLNVGLGFTEILFVLSINFINKNLAFMMILLFPIAGILISLFIHYKRKNTLIAMAVLVLLDSFIFIHFYNGLQLLTHLIYITLLIYTYVLLYKIHQLNSLKNKNLSDHFIQ